MTSRASVTSSFASSVSFESMLEKRSKMPGSFMDKKCWCVLDDGKMTYYKDAKKGPQSSGGCINIAQVQSVMRSSKGHTFHIITSSATHIFSAASADLREQWVKAIQDAMAVTSRKLSIARQSLISGSSGDQDSDTGGDDGVPSLSPMPVVVSPTRLSTADRRTKTSQLMTPAPASGPTEITLHADDCAALNDAKSGYANAADVQKALRSMKEHRGSETANMVAVAKMTNNDGTSARADPQFPSEAQATAPSMSAPARKSHSSLLPSAEDTVDVSSIAKAGALATVSMTSLSPTSSEGSKPDVGGATWAESDTSENGEVLVLPPPLPDVIGVSEEGQQEEVLTAAVSATVAPDDVPTSTEKVDAFPANDGCSVIADEGNALPPQRSSVVATATPTASKSSSDKSVRSVVFRRNSKVPKQESIDAVATCLPSEMPTVVSPPVIEVTLVVAEAEPPTIVPDLANPWLSSDAPSTFDDLRSYLENNFSGAMTTGSLAYDGKPGKAIDSLRFFLSNLD